MSPRDHLEFLMRLAEEMWWLETRYLDVDTVQILAELLTEDRSLSPETARHLVERVAAYGFLTTEDTLRNTLRFEHEVFYGYFLARKLKQCLEEEPRDLRRFLNRSVLDDSLADQTVGLYRGDATKATQAAESLCQRLRKGATDGVARGNGGGLVARLMKSCGGFGRGVHLHNLDFHGDSFGDIALHEPEFTDCQFSQVDLTGARMYSPKFLGCVFQMPRVSMEVTRFEEAEATLSGCFHGILVDGDEDASDSDQRPQTFYAPQHIEAVLRKLGMRSEADPLVVPVSPYSIEQRRRIRLLEAFLHKMDRRFQVSEEDLARFHFIRDADWEAVFSMLVDHGVVKKVSRRMSGPPKVLIRLAYPPDVIRKGEDTNDRRRPSLTAFWEDLLAD